MNVLHFLVVLSLGIFVVKCKYINKCCKLSSCINKLFMHKSHTHTHTHTSPIKLSKNVQYLFKRIHDQFVMIRRNMFSLTKNLISIEIAQGRTLNKTRVVGLYIVTKKTIIKWDRYTQYFNYKLYIYPSESKTIRTKTSKVALSWASKSQSLCCNNFISFLRKKYLFFPSLPSLRVNAKWIKTLTTTIS